MIKNYALLLFSTVILFSWADNRGSSVPFISGDTFRAIADHLYDETSTSIDVTTVKNGDSIFVKTDYVKRFVTQILPKIACQVILIIHNSDLPFPYFSSDFLDDPRIIAVFTQNINSVHPKVFAIPIGIANQCWPHGNVHIFKKNIRPFFEKKSKLLYMNFSPSTYPQEREPVYNLFKNKKYCTVAQPTKDLSSYLSEMSEHMFVLSPRGNGLDCHRTWEALIVGCVPIVRTSPLDILYKDLPVIIVDSWQEISEEFLMRKWEELTEASHFHQKHLAQHWINIIKAAQREILDAQAAE